MEIRFSYETKYGIFSDALILDDDHAYTEQEIQAMQEQRRDNWVAYIDSTQQEPALPSEPEPEPVSPKTGLGL